MKQRRKRALYRMTLRQMEAIDDRQDGLWDVTTLVTERVGCVRDLARLLTAIGTLDVEEALTQIAEWKRPCCS